MNRHDLPPAMREALSLTQAGRVLEATRAIQQALGGGRSPAADPRTEAAPEGAARLAPPAGRGPSA
ncbi:hypothetical protein ACTZWW_06065, partial [Salinarimonas sp. NSM]|uniref:hypothetical protein n=1 Tax=Salinarimonas sp. NSM TaxID=3458003 RepID=UPI004035A885